MMPAAKCVTAVPEDKLSSVVESLVKERIGCVVVVDPSDNTAVGIVTKQDVNRLFLKLVSARADASAPAREQRGRRVVRQRGGKRARQQRPGARGGR